MDTSAADPPTQGAWTAERIKEEYIIQRMNLWMSRRDKEPLTALELAVKATGIQFDKPLSLPEEIKPACVIPTGDGDYYYIPLEDHWIGAPEELREKARRIDACARNPAYRELFKEAERLLDREILESRHLDGHKPVDVASFAASLSRVPFTKKVHFCAKKRLMGISLAPNFDSSQAKFAKLNFVIADVNKDAKINMNWDNLEWPCTLSELRETCTAYARSIFSYADAMSDQIKLLESIKTCPSAALQADELLGQLKFQLQIERQKENPFREGEAEIALNWVQVHRRNNNSPGEVQLINDLSFQSLPETGLHTHGEFYRMKYEAQQSQDKDIFPIFMRPWHARYYCMIRHVVRIHAQELAYVKQLEEEEKRKQEKEKNKEGKDETGEQPAKGKRKRADKGHSASRKKRATSVSSAVNGVASAVDGVSTGVNGVPNSVNGAPNMVNGVLGVANGVPNMVNGRH